MTTYTIPLPWATPPLSGNRTRGNPHARANEVKAAKEAARWAIRAANLPQLVGAEITLCYRVATRHRRDADNLAPTLKAVQDALVLEGIVPDDSWVHIPSATCRISPPNGEPAAMWLEVTALGELWMCDQCTNGYWGEPPDACWHGQTRCDECGLCPDCSTEERRP